jgi:hypothetical protein
MSEEGRKEEEEEGMKEEEGKRQNKDYLHTDNDAEKKEQLVPDWASRWVPTIGTK